MADGQHLPDEIDAEVKALSSEYQFFHWHLAFPEVFRKGGFDCVLGNPPWEMVQFQEVDFFADIREIVEQKTRAARQRAIEKLAETAPRSYQDYLDHLRRVDGERHFFYTSREAGLPA